jgi:poly-gamma-glutamate capsule biosynthesis protein CapA/YwtB (metallophosphatase superfamily)
MLERLSLNRPRWIAPRDTVALRDGAAKARLIALGDVALIRTTGSRVLGRFDGVRNLLEAADIRVANLEAVVTSRRQPALAVGAGMRAEPDALDTLTTAGFNVVSAANNHALDYGSEGLADCVEMLTARGIGVCGLEEDAGPQRCVKRVANTVRIGFLGFCDDINAARAGGMPRPVLWSNDAEAAIAAARRDTDVLIVQMHWGYEFSLHPLLRHRNQARRAVEIGAHAVICHHAHVPLGFEIWKGCPIVYGLGNGCIPISPYMIDGHPWADRSIALELGLARDGIATLRLHPLRLQRDGSPVLLEGKDKGALLAGVAQMSARLREDAFLDRCERARLTYETAGLIAALEEAAAREDETSLEERVAQLELPRQQSLIEFLERHPKTVSLARGLRAATAAKRAGRLSAALREPLRELKAAPGVLQDLYRWRDALRARLP